MDGPAEFQDAAGWSPAAVVGALDEQRAAVVVGDDPGDVLAQLREDAADAIDRVLGA